LRLDSHTHINARAPLARLRASVFCVLFLLCAAAPHARAQPSDFERKLGRQMLDIIKEDVEKNYYDPALGGMNIETHFNAAGEKIKGAATVTEIFNIISSAVTDLDDSHTFFIPPMMTLRVEYGWQMQMIGDKCYVVAVRPGSDAERKGLKVGDRVLNVEGFEPTRGGLWKMKYFYRVQPRVGMRAFVQTPGDKPRLLDLLAKIEQDPRALSTSRYDFEINTIRDAESESRVNAHRYIQSRETFIWKMPAFDLEDSKIDEMMGKVKKHKALILDLRGNGGGYETTLLRLVGHFFDRDVKIGDIKSRKESKPLVAKTRGANAFKGQLIVLVDSESGSAAEIFARVVQIEKRGTVIGDQSAGAVMRSRFFRHESGTTRVIAYGTFIAISDVLMTDGKSLERVGVSPDELLLPTAQDLAAARDPVLSRAAAIVGVELSPDVAGKMFPVEWRK
jgi:carboxyl-terminal processing protease